MICFEDQDSNSELLQVLSITVHGQYHAFVLEATVTDLAILEAFEEWSDPDETDLIIPENDIVLFVPRHVEFVLKYYNAGS